MQKPRKSFPQIWNMNFGFLGIQFGWALQLANMSAIYEYLGARPDQIPILWLAAPLTGLLIQPLIGEASDRTWTRLGRRRPYFLAGAIISSSMLLLMPNAPSIWAAAAFLWLLDASNNVSMEPFRAFVTDLLPEGQRTTGFAMQSIFIGLGSVVASLMPLILTHLLHPATTPDAHAIPVTVRYSFYLGAFAFLAAVLWTVFTTPEYPPEDLSAFAAAKAEHPGLIGSLADIVDAVRKMPLAMRRLAPVQLFTWLGLFCMWLYLSIAIAHNVFGADKPNTPLYNEAIVWAGICSAVYNAVCFVFSFALPTLAKAIGRTHTHSACLVCGALGLVSVPLIHNKWYLLLSMVGVGIAWASTLSMPYAVLASSLPPARTGVYMGIFNFFIVIPEILMALFGGPVVTHLFHNNRILPVVAGGVSMIFAAALMQRVEDPQTLSLQDW